MTCVLYHPIGVNPTGKGEQVPLHFYVLLCLLKTLQLHSSPPPRRQGDSVALNYTSPQAELYPWTDQIRQLPGRDPEPLREKYKTIWRMSSIYLRKKLNFLSDHRKKRKKKSHALTLVRADIYDGFPKLNYSDVS